MVILEVATFGSMIQYLLERSASRVWYLWDRKDTHGKKTLALANLNSQHDQEATKESDERDYVVFTDRGD